MGFDIKKEYTLKADKEVLNEDFDDFTILNAAPKELNPEILKDNYNEEDIINEIKIITHKSSNIHIINKIFAVIFISVIVLYCLGNFITTATSSLINSFEVNTEKTINRDFSYIVKNSTIIKDYNENIILKDELNNFLGLSKNMKKGSFQFNGVSEDIYKDKTGRLTYICKYENIEPYAEKIKELNNLVQENNGYFLYVQEPFKILNGEVNNDENNLYYSLKDYSNLNADDLVANLVTSGVNCYDLRNVLTETNRQLEPMFFFTDSRWTIDTAFKSYKNIADVLTTDGKANKESFKLFNNYDNFSYSVVDNAFVGNQGTVLGSVYLNKTDSFDMFIPYARTSFKVETVKSDGAIIEKEGDFSKAIITKPTQKVNLFDTYLGSPAPKIKITNNLNTVGEKLLIIGDDFVNPLSSFLSLNFSETVVVNPSLYKGSLTELIEQNDFNYVIMAYNPKSFQNSDFFKLN